jgi:hypothetical protein
MLPESCAWLDPKKGDDVVRRFHHCGVKDIFVTMVRFETKKGKTIVINNSVKKREEQGKMSIQVILKEVRKVII